MTEAPRPQVRFGLFVGQVGMTWSDLRRTVRAGRRAGLRPHLVGRPPDADGSTTRPADIRGVDVAGGSRGADQTGSHRHPGHQQHLSPPVGACEAGRHGRPHQRRPADPWHRHRLVPGRAPQVRHRLSRCARAGRKLEEALDVITALMTGEPAASRAAITGSTTLTLCRRPSSGRASRFSSRRTGRGCCALRLAVPTCGTPSRPPRAPRPRASRPTSPSARGSSRKPAGLPAATRPRFRRSVWVGSEPFVSLAAYAAFVDEHRSLGFTDLMTALPPPDRWSMVRDVATSLIPRLRERARRHPLARPRPPTGNHESPPELHVT